MKVYFDALGCPKALVDAERMCYFLEKGGHSLVGTPEEADAVIINTCGFIQKAKEENINAILEHARRKKNRPDLRIVVSGCLTERYRADLLKAIPEIDAAIGVRDPERILKTLDGPRSSGLLDRGAFHDTRFTTERRLYFSGLHFAYLKLSEGCNRTCSFCSIPLIRGRQRSRTLQDLLREARFLSDSGVRELILISEDTLSWGSDLPKKHPLTDLLSELEKMDFRWIRLMYLYPDPRRLLPVAEFIAGRGKFCKYIDMPLQHASGRVIKSMRRAGDADQYGKLVGQIRSLNPEFRIRSAFILGYPGETPKDFRILTDFLKEARLDRVGFFEFSSEEGTRAESLRGRVPARTVSERMRTARRIQDAISRKNLKTLAGKTLACISDGITRTVDGTTFSLYRTEYDAPEIDGSVLVRTSPEEDSGADFADIRITGVRGSHDLEGERADRRHPGDNP